jgi:hypothetical protein
VKTPAVEGPLDRPTRSCKLPVSGAHVRSIKDLASSLNSDVDLSVVLILETLLLLCSTINSAVLTTFYFCMPSLKMTQRHPAGVTKRRLRLGPQHHDLDRRHGEMRLIGLPTPVSTQLGLANLPRP